MSEAPSQRLAEALGDPDVHADLATLSADEAGRLVSSIEALKTHQEQALEKAIEEALSHIPRVLRRSVRKKLFS